MRTNKRLAVTVIAYAALAAPAAASAMPAPLASGGPPVSPPYPAGHARPASIPRGIVESGVGTVTVLLLTGGGVAAGLAGGLGGSRLRRRHSLA
jgi:hypothetical protein